MPTSTVDVADSAPLSHPDAMALLEAELGRTLELLRSLDNDDWTARTVCPDWDVHHMYLHVLGACEASASIRENLHQMRRARRHRSRHGGPLEAALSNVQVRERSEASPAELVERLAAVAPKTLRKRTTMPAALRRLKISVDGPVAEKWTLGYLVDTIYLRDLWMHRVDAAAATQRELSLTSDHDGIIVRDVVAEWARRHGRPFTLTLAGPAGGTYASPGSTGDAGAPEALELDAVAFCRALAGRSDAPGLLATVVPF
ncbi:MAG: maleylpyruvate isomerase family mycothiol-dependent enzyme [Acidimicrobiia bacterium]